jgi:tetratricopeptide (TPR) repeat protein
MRALGRIWAPAVLCASLLAGQDIEREAGQAREANRLDEAIRLYRTSVSENPKWTEGWWYLGTILYDRDDYAGAAPAFQKASALDPKSGTSLVMLGLCEAKLGKDSEALKHLQRGRTLGIAANPQLRHVMLYTLGTLWLDRGNDHGDFDNAQDALDALVREGVESEDLTIALGLAALRIRPPAENPELVRAAGHAESLAAQRGKLAEALSEYEHLAASFPRIHNLQFAYGKFLLDNHYDDQAVAAFQREIENTPNHLLARLGIAGTKTRTDPAGGLPYAEQAVKLAPELPEAHYLLGVLLLDTGKVSQAIAELEIAQRAEPEVAKIYFALGRAYSRVKRTAEAARARATFTRLNKQAEENHP